jgi:hypothetical protein
MQANTVVTSGVMHNNVSYSAEKIHKKVEKY